jgi:hypothetical protein
MAPRDHPSPLPDGASCTACGAPVPAGRIRILAGRDGFAFVRLACADCGSAALGLVMDADGERPFLDIATDVPATRRAAVGPGAAPISLADVEAVRRDLARWDGDLVGWLDR